MNKLIQYFQKVYTPGSELVVDETIVPFHGRVEFPQYVPGKSHRYECKIFKLCKVDGYTWNFEASCGVSKCQETLGAADSLVVRLTEKLLEKGTAIYVDNYYMPHLLAKYLLTHKTYMCGTVQKNR